MAAKLTDEGSFVSCPARRQCPPNTPAASAATYPLRCFAPQWARFDNRHSTSAPTPTLTAVSGSGAGIILRPGASAFFVSDGPISSNSGRNGGKNAGRNCVSALPQRAMPVRCRPRFPSRNRRFPDRCRSPDCASTAFRCRCLLLRQKLFVLPCRRLRNNYILCPTGTPTFAALRRQRRDLIIAKNDQRTSPYPHCCQRQRRKRYKRSPEPTTSPAAPIPRSQHRQICTYPPRAKGSLNRRFEWFSLVTFFLQKKKVTRAGARNAPACARRRRPPYPGGISRHLPIAVLRAAMGAI